MPAPTAMANSTLRTLRRALGYALDDLGVYAVAVATSSTITATALVNATPNASGTLYNGAWVHAPDSLRQTRRVRTNGYTASAGEFAIFPNWTVAPAPGAAFEVNRLFPALATTGVAAEDTDYLTIVNRGLRRLAVPDRVTIAITTAEAYPLVSWPWLDRPERLLGIWEPAATGSNLVPADWRGPRLSMVAGVPRLELRAPFSTASGLLTLEVLRPVHTLVNGVESTSGLANDTDYVPIDVEDALPALLLEAYGVLMHRAPGRSDGAGWEAKYEQQLQLAMSSRFWDRSQIAPSRSSSSEEAA